MQKSSTHIREYFRWYLLLLLIALSVIIWLMVLREDRQGILKFEVLDIGQGDSLFIESPSGVQVLVDGGPNKNLMREIGKVLPWYDRKIDMIVVTNPDADHYEGFISLLDKYKVISVLEPGTFNKYEAYTVLENKLKNKGVKKIIAIQGQVIDLGGGAYLKILFPDRDVSGLSSNDGSIVMKLVYGDTSVMLQGDSTEKIEHFLLTNIATSTLNSTILKAGHHGSKTSSSFEYVKAANPKWTVISSGKNNTYGHPNIETLETMKKLNIPTLDTCNNGDLIFESDGKIFTLKNKNPKEAIVGCKID